ncbi:Spy0128 family protein [Olsenella profusa]|uniref:VWA domain-containing protein n=1 Tax=Olsenella profusa TaxID=138595 RepID=A0ABS2F0J0_9ACTN|nr:FctA domain-containing protein [Olsenella profusa]MBM6774486.1 VWA domain-containing protein [Olsenella profusa]
MAARAAASGTTSVDPDTTNAWENYTAPGGETSTQNVGRIWTDKSVFNTDYTFQGQLSGSVQKGDSDFVVGLSALSSTSNLTETITTSQPLDIVLVLDVSGSMDDPMESYEPVYDLRTNWGAPTYYIELNGEYQEISHDRQGWYYETGWGWSSTRHDVTPKTSADDPNGTQVYQYVEGEDKIDALKEAVNGFIDTANESNSSIQNPDDKSRISIVKFAGDTYRYEIGNDRGEGGSSSYNYTQVVSDFTSDADALKSDVRAIRAGGATSADMGLSLAQDVFEGGYHGNHWDNDTYLGARDNAKKVVIFFTDGEPNHSSGWNGAVANDAIDVARQLKNDGTTIYSIGVFGDANPSDTEQDFNGYMHGVSSNYPNAQSYNNLGQRAPESDYYKSATNANELDSIFEDIFQQESQSTGSGSPIQSITQAGAQETPGNLTFTDRLGSYMEVTGTGAGADKMQLAYADQLYTSKSRDEQQIQGGTVYTYHFDGQVAGNAVYGAANLSDISVKVTHYNDAAQGDLVQVTIPASLIPLRNYDVNADNKTMTVSKAYPIRLFYGVSLKQGAEDAINTGSGDVYDAIAQNNVSADKQTLDFYTNLYTNGSGDTTAVFTPNEANKFYYYTSDTPLYVDEACTERATRQNIDQYNKVYYQDTYYVQTENGGYEQRTTSVAVNRDGSEFSHIAFVQWGSGYGNAYMPAHTQRTDRPATLNTDKFENKTDTAETALVPSWSGVNEVSQALGNNGKISYPMPGSLEIKKTVDWTNGSDQTQQDKNSFIFDISLTDANDKPISGTYNYYVDNAETASGQVTFTDDGKASIQVNGGTTVRIDGLASGAKFTVTEQGVGQNGFTVTSDTTSQTDVENTNTTDGIVTGTIPAGSQASLSFVNQYHAEDVNLSTNAKLQVKKNLTGRDWRDTDEFTFAIDGLAGPNGTAAPEPDETTIKVDDETADYTKAFGDITFTQPGEYRYAVTEVSDGIQTIPGIDYSAARYRVVVNVSDNGTGNLVVDSVTIEQRLDDEGHTPQSQPTIDNNTMVFTNNYNLDAATTNIDGTKNYTDTTGKNPINADKFTFQLKALGGYETEGGSADHYTVDAADVPMPDTADENHAVTTNNTGYEFGFPTISYDGNAVGKTFVYEVSELKGSEQGMTYDEDTKYTVKVAVSEIDDPENPGQKIIVATPDLDPQDIVFNNTYDPADATLAGKDAIHGTKKLTGREMKEGETFYFQLTQTGGPATPDPKDGDAYVQVLNAAEYATVSQSDQDMYFNFKDMTFSVAGTYTFQVNEVANQYGDETTDGNGLTYDKNVCTVTVEVKDNHDGTMTAMPSYSNQSHSETDKAVFDNTYQAEMNYGANGAGGINVTKQMLDRPMAEGDFSFTITPEGEDKAYETFTNTAAEMNGTVTMKQLQNLTFDQDDAGKTFTYIVDESDPAEGQALPEVDYDQSQYKVEIQVIDNGDSTMHTVTTVTKIKNAKGKSVNKVVVDHADSSADGYTAPTFGFVNDYNPKGTTAGGEDAEHPLQVTKTVEGAPSPEGVEYSFTLTPAEDYGEKVTGLTDGKLTTHTTGSIAKGESQTVDFGQLTFTEPGNYTFNVQEDQPVVDAGWTFDDANGDGVTEAHQITVVVTDLNDKGEYDGNLYIQSVNGSPVQVTNSYHANSITVGGEGADQQINVQKTVTGADSDENFKFKLEPIVDETNTEEVWANNVEPAEGNDGTATIDGGVTQEKASTTTFGGITFKAEGTYQFNVTEVQAHDGVDDPAGWTYDTHTSVVTVTVTDEGNDGQLDAAVSYDNSQAKTDADKGCKTVAAFTNSYAPGEITTTDDTSVDTNIKVTKSVTGAPATEAFTFSLKLADGQDGSNVFEGTGDDKTPFDGVEVTTSDNIAADSTETKAFAGVTFTKAGDYKFVIDETTTTDKAGWTYDGSTHEITVRVADQDAKLVITGIDGNNPTFTNAYTTSGTLSGNGEEAIKVTKSLTGRANDEWLDGDSFKAMLTAQESTVDGQTMAADSVPMPGGRTGGVATVDLTKDNHESVAFGDITYTRPGTYNYTLAEVQENAIDGVYYSLAEYNVVVTATDNGNGTLTVTSEITQTKDDDGFGSSEEGYTGSTESVDVATFTNVYQPNFATLDGAQNLTVSKNLEGRDWYEGDEWTFALALTDGDASKVIMPAQTQLTINANTPNFAASFGNITFRAAGTYIFTVTESGVVEGVTNDTDAERTIVVDVNDDTKGNLIATVNAERSEGLTFTNTYQPTGTTISGDSAITVQKTLTGRDWADGEEFGFTIKNIQKPEGLESAPMPENDTITVGKPAEGNVATAQFGDMTFTQAGTYVYEITENPGDGSLSYDDHTATVTVAVFENQADGTLSAQVSYDNSTATTDGDKAVTGAAAFTNAYNTEGFDLSFSGTKHLEGRDFQPGDEFTFMVNAGADVPVPDGVTVTSRDESSWTGTVTIKPESGNDATIDFGKAAITQAGEYTYLITEQNTGIDGMGYDESTHTITFKAEDNGQGGFNVTQTAGDLTWVNNAAFKMDKPVSLEGTKSMTGADMSNGQFTFTVEPQDGAPMGEGTQAVTNGEPTQNEDGSWTASLDVLKDVSYDAPGDYVYLVTEQNDGQPGFTYDGTQYKVTVTVAQDGTSSTKVEKSTDGENWAEATAVAFNNSYATEGSATLNGSANLGGTKTLSGRDWTNDDSFTFILAAGDQPTQQAIADGTIHMPDTMEVVQGAYSDGAQVPFNFGNIVFDQAGTYTFTISEQQPGDDGFVGPTAGMTYDDHVRTITVTVVDNGNGQLEAAAEAEGDANWTNTYKVDGENPGTLSGAENLEVTKVIDGRDWQDGDSFTFELTADEANPEGATLPENASGITITNETTGHKAAFGDITFSKPGNYTFYVNEQMPQDDDHATEGVQSNGVTYDGAQRVIEVSVVDNYDGTLTPSATVTSDHGLTFTNTYKAGGTTTLPTTGEGSFTLRKVLTGKAWNGDEFTFKVEAADSASANYLPEQTEVTVNAKTGTNDEGYDFANFAFGPITYDQAGTYTYTVTELPGSNAGIQYDTHTATVTVTVSDNLHGGYIASATVANGTFTNEYATSLDFGAEGQGGLWIQKSLTNHDIADDQFEFTVTAADQASADKAGFDGMSKVVKSTAATMDDNGTAMSMAEIFSDATFTQDDADDTYTYTVRETKGGEFGYTNDDTVYTVTITTADDGQGGIKVTTTVSADNGYNQSYVYDNDETTDDPQAIVPFSNSYEATGTLGGDGEGNVTINATKSLTNRPMTDGEFTFNVTDASGNQVATGTNDANGNVTFSAIDYTKDGMLDDVENGLASYSQVDGKDTFTYTYTVAEDQASFDEGVTAIAGSFQITVTVTDNNDGTLGIAVAYPDGGDSLQFRNAYGEGETGQATLNINGAKVLNIQSGNNAPDIAGKYSFTLTGSEGAPMPATTTATNDAAGNVNFGDVTFTMEGVFGDTGGQAAATDEAATDEASVAAKSAVRTKTFTYTVTESGTVAGVTNDAAASKTFTVTVTDNGDGTISVATDQATGAEFSFTNTYAVTPTQETPTGDDGATGTGHITIGKELTGRAMTEGEFGFALTDANGTVVSQGTNDANGNVELPAITFNEPGDYAYTLAEVNGGQGGVTFDQAVYQVTAHVTDNGDGSLSVAWTVKNSAGEPVNQLTFHNSYSTAPATVVFGGSKVLDGRELAAGEFSFELRDHDTGKVLQTVTNAEDGSFAFDTQVFGGVGEYTFDIAEVKGDAEGVTYDDMVYTAKVTVTDDGNGHLLVTGLTYNDKVELPVFTNTYVEPAAPEPQEPEPAAPTPEPEIPDTGDHTSSVLPAVLIACGVALAGGAWALRKHQGR